MKEKKDENNDIHSKGNNNVIVQNSQEVQININKVERKILKFTPTDRHISSAQAAKIQETIANLVEKETASGDVSAEAMFKKYYAMLKKRYKVATYREIPAHLGDAAIHHLKQLSAIKRTKIRRTDNDNWRKELYKAIHAKSKSIGLSKGELYGLIYNKIGKQVPSLTQLGERDLKKVYDIIMNIKK